MSAKRHLFKILSYWPPFLGAGIRVKSISPDYRRIEVDMKLKFWNKNYVGTQFGGSLYSMVDPFFMLILIENLGPEYIVWDKAAAIRFKKPGRGTVRATFEVSQAQIDDIRERLLTREKIEPKFSVQILNEEDQVVAEVDKLLHVRKKG